MELFDDIDDAPRKRQKLTGFKLNGAFAQEYDERKKREELSKLHDKYGSDMDDDDGSSSTSYSSEDSEAELATPAVDVAILKTLARIRKGDASIYEAGRDIFAEEEQAAPIASTSKAKSKKGEKPLSLSAYQRQTLLAGGEAEDRARPTPAQEAASLRAETLNAFHQAAASSGEEDGDDDDDLLVPRLKTADEVEEDDEAYRAFLRKEAGPEALAIGDDDEEFLRSYILNRGWRDREAQHVPTHEEILADPPPKPSSKGKGKQVAFEPLHEDDSDFDERADDFEHKYNFRFEETGGNDLVTHSRNVDNSLRRTDDARKEKRKRKAEEKAARKAEKARLLAEERAEKDRLRELQGEATQDRLKKLRDAIGAGVNGLEGVDLDADFDPEEHDRKMALLFDNRFYADEQVDADGKPTWEDSDAEEEHLPYLEAEEDEDAYDPSAPVKKETKKERKKRKREAQAIASAAADEAGAGVPDPEEAERRAYDAFFNRFEYEDFVGDEPTRFRYAPVDATSFDLTPEEILLATDAELNTYVGLSKLATYRPSKSSTAQKRSRKARELRQLLHRRAWGEATTRDEIGHASEILQRRQAQRDAAAAAGGAATGANAAGLGVVPKKRKGRKEREKRARKEAAEGEEA